MNRILIVVLLASALACGNEPSKEPPNEAGELEMQDFLPGTWEMNSLSVLALSHEGIADSVYSLQIREQDWLKVYRTQPSQYAFRADKKFRIYFRDIEGQPIDSAKGIWNSFGDTLMLISPEETIQYRVRYKAGSLAEYRAQMDWDQDGEEDDQFQATFRKVSQSSF